MIKALVLDFDGLILDTEANLETMANKDKLFGIDDFRGACSFESLRICRIHC